MTQQTFVCVAWWGNGDAFISYEIFCKFDGQNTLDCSKGIENWCVIASIILQLQIKRQLAKIWSDLLHWHENQRLCIGIYQALTQQRHFLSSVAFCLSNSPFSLKFKSISFCLNQATQHKYTHFAQLQLATYFNFLFRIDCSICFAWFCFDCKSLNRMQFFNQPFPIERYSK